MLIKVNSQKEKTLEFGNNSASLDALILAELLAVQEAGLIGSLSFLENKTSLEEWDFQKDFWRLGILASPELNRVSAAVVLSCLQIFPRLVDILHISNVVVSTEPGFAESYTSFKTRIFRSGIIVHKDFEEIALKPYVRAIPGVSSGISIGTMLILLSLGSLLYSRLHYDSSLDLLAKFAEASGWSKIPQAGFEAQKSNWNRKKDSPILMLSSNYSPAEDFSNVFFLFLTHSKYLKQMSPDVYEVLEDIFQAYRVV